METFTYEPMERLCTYVQQVHEHGWIYEQTMEHFYYMESGGILQGPLVPRHVCFLGCWLEMIHGAHDDMRLLYPLGLHIMVDLDDPMH